MRAATGFFLAGCFAVLWLAAAEAEILEASILSYNIYWGGQDHDPVFGRQDEWLEVIIAAAPDVIMLQECNGWLASEQDLLNQYLITLNAALPGGPVYHGVAADANSDFNVALITYQPILSWEAVTSVFVDGETVNLAHACLHAVLDFEGEPQHVLNMHFSPAGRIATSANGRPAPWCSTSPNCRPGTWSG